MGQQIIDELKKMSSSTHETARGTLAKMRKHGDIDYIQVKKTNVENIRKVVPKFAKILDNGCKIRNHTYMYFKSSKIRFLIRTCGLKEVQAAAVLQK